MKWRKDAVRNVAGIDVPAYEFEWPPWWQLLALIFALIEYIRSGLHVRVIVGEEVAAAGYFIGSRKTDGTTRCAAEPLHHREFLFVVGGGACKVFAMDKDDNKVDIVSARRSSSLEPGHATLPAV